MLEKRDQSCFHVALCACKTKFHSMRCMLHYYKVQPGAVEASATFVAICTAFALLLFVWILAKLLKDANRQRCMYKCVNILQSHTHCPVCHHAYYPASKHNCHYASAHNNFIGV